MKLHVKFKLNLLMYFMSASWIALHKNMDSYVHLPTQTPNMWGQFIADTFRSLPCAYGFR